MSLPTRFQPAPILGLALLLFNVQRAVAQPVAPARWPAEAIIRFDATSTLHDFGGEVPAQPFVLSVTSNTWSAEAEVLAGMMATASGGRDKNMHRMLNTNDHPRIHGKLTQVPMPVAGKTNVTLSLKIRDEQHDLPVDISNWSETSSNLSFHAEWQLSLKQFKLKPPSVMGVLRVGDTVCLNADVIASKTATLTNPPAGTNVVPDKR